MRKLTVYLLQTARRSIWLALGNSINWIRKNCLNILPWFRRLTLPNHQRGKQRVYLRFYRANAKPKRIISEKNHSRSNRTLRNLPRIRLSQILRWIRSTLPRRSISNLEPIQILILRRRLAVLQLLSLVLTGIKEIRDPVLQDRNFCFFPSLLCGWDQSGHPLVSERIREDIAKDPLILPGAVSTRGAGIYPQTISFKRISINQVSEYRQCYYTCFPLHLISPNITK